jgi:GT2 family glycosyltransferase
VTKDKVFINKNIQKSMFRMAPVEIIIPFHNEHSKVSRLIESIYLTVRSNQFLVTLVDDCSDNKDYIKLIEKRKLPGMRCFQLDEHKGFGASINFALSKPFKSRRLPNGIPWVCIMHSDVKVEGNWLFSLGQSIYTLNQSGVQMISPRTNNPTVDVDNMKCERGEVIDDFILEEGYLPLYCALMDRGLFKKVGLFKEYSYAGCETEDFAIRMRKMGFRQAVCGSSWVYHEGGATLKNFEKNKKVQGILKENREKFLKENS